jgi:hypothetical protein
LVVSRRLDRPRWRYARKWASDGRARARMIISRTPLRVSFVGGGTDMAVFYRRYGGAVISTSINRYV